MLKKIIINKIKFHNFGMRLKPLSNKLIQKQFKNNLKCCIHEGTWVKLFQYNRNVKTEWREKGKLCGPCLIPAAVTD